MAAKSSNRTERLATNAVFGVAAWILPLIIVFFTTPILVRGLGNEQYGLYAAITGFMAYSFSFGVGKIAAKYVAEYRSAGEADKVNPVISATLLFGASIGIAGAAILAASARLIVNDVLLVPKDYVEISVVSLYLACIVTVATMIGQTYQYTLQGLHKFGTILIITNINGLLIGFGSIAIIWSGGGIVGLLAWNAAVASAAGILFFAAARNGVPNLRLTFEIDGKIVRSVMSYGVSIILYQVFANVLYIVERALVLRKFGAEALAFYSVPMALAVYLQSFIASFAVVLFPMMNELLNDRERQTELYKKASKITFAIVAFAVITFISTGRSGLQVWISQEYADRSYPLLVIHALIFGTISMGVIAWQIAEGFRRARINSFISASWLVISVPLMFAAADRFGPAGIAAAKFAGVLTTVPAILYCERRFLGKIFIGFWIGSVGRIAAASALTALVETLVLQNLRAGWSALAAAGASGAIIFGFTIFVSGYFTQAERSLIIRLLANKVGLRSGIARAG